MQYTITIPMLEFDEMMYSNQIANLIFHFVKNKTSNRAVSN